MAHWFDDLARALASGELSRRDILKKAAGAFAAGAAASLVPEQVLAAGNADCATWCHQVFSGSAAGKCTADAAHGNGACYQCGPKGTNAGLCGGACCPTGQACVKGKCCVPDLATCGSNGQCCSGVCCNGSCCPNGYTCVQNVCTAPGTCTPLGFACQSDDDCCSKKCCSNTCTDVSNDPNNCGNCRLTCLAPYSTCCGGTCTNLQNNPANCGACGKACAANEACCGVKCINTQSDINNCGSCGTTCTNPHGTTSCVAGVCSPVCASGYGNCDNNPNNGCETALNTNANCGSCGNACTVAGTSCQNGQCLCSNGQPPQNGTCPSTCTNCASGCCQGSTCISYALQSNTTCGRGGVTCAPCPSGQSCVSGQCCSSGQVCTYSPGGPTVCCPSGSTCLPDLGPPLVGPQNYICCAVGSGYYVCNGFCCPVACTCGTGGLPIPVQCICPTG